MTKTDDHAVTAIEDLVRNGQVPTYAWLKHEFGRRQISAEVWQSLNRGRGILKTVDQLDQYLYSYAPMVASQWQYAAQALTSQPGNSAERLIDYGCGQGLAGLLLHDYLGPTVLVDVQSVIAIEPSAVALRRATAIYSSLAPRATVTPINKGFEALSIPDLRVGGGETTHIFSNVLDIDGYDHVNLLRKGLSYGEHTIIAVGHDRTSHGYSQGLERVKTAVETGAVHPAIRVRASGTEAFKCGNRGESAVLWLCKFEVSDE